MFRACVSVGTLARCVFVAVSDCSEQNAIIRDVVSAVVLQQSLPHCNGGRNRTIECPLPTTVCNVSKYRILPAPPEMDTRMKKSTRIFQNYGQANSGNASYSNTHLNQ